MNDIGNQKQVLCLLSQILAAFKKRISMLSEANKLINLEKNGIKFEVWKQTYQDSQMKSAELYQSIKTKIKEIHEITIRRFLLRLKEMIFSLKKNGHCEKLPPSFYLSLKKYLQVNENQINILELLSLILLGQPSQLKKLHTEFSSQILPKQQPIKQRKQVIFQSHINDAHAKSIKAFNNQFLLLNCLDIDQTFLRKNYYLSQQDLHRKSSYLYDDYAQRNRKIEEGIKMYYTDFLKFRNQKVRKTKSSPRKTSTFSQKKTDNFLTFDPSQQFQRKNPKQEYSIKDSRFGLFFPNQSKQISGFSKYNNFNFKKRRNKTQPHQNGSKLLNSIENDEQKLQKFYFRISNRFPIKKVQIHAEKIEMTPEKTESTNEDCKKINGKSFGRKTQQYYKKRFTLIGQEKLGKLKDKNKSLINSILYERSKIIL